MNSRDGEAGQETGLIARPVRLPQFSHRGRWCDHTCAGGVGAVEMVQVKSLSGELMVMF